MHDMTKKYLLILLAVFLLLPITVKAIPAYPVRKTATLKDGSKLEVTFTGDEHFSFYKSDDGRAFRLLDDNRFQEIPQNELMGLCAKAGENVASANVRRAARRVGSATPNLKGKKKGLVVLVSFFDNDFTIENPQAYFNNVFNKTGFNENGMTGSVADYFNAQSYGAMQLDFDVVGPYKLSKSMGYYGAPSNGQNDSNPQQMAVDAVKMANPDVNFADYDWNNDGEVDQVFIIYAGYGQNYGASSNTIWPHESSMETFNVKLDGMKLATYGCTCELRGTEKSGGKPDGIGAACHEFSHCMGLPDMYDSQYTGNYGTGCWDLMNQGCYLDDSCTPCCYTAYERMFCGWLTPIELNSETQITGMKALASNPEAYILYNDGNRNEFYMLENRQHEGFDAALYNHGLLVTHITYDASAWSSNAVNVGVVQRCCVVPADNSFSSSYASIAADVYPGSMQNTALTNRSVPAATLNTPNADGEYLLNKSIEHITETNGTISFLACRPDLAIPQVTVNKLSDNSFRAEWPAVNGAEAYELQLDEFPAKNSAEDALVLEETFEKCYAKSNGYTNISTKLDQYTDNKGFTGSVLFQGKSGLLCGTSSSTGELKTPWLRATETGAMTIAIGVAPFEEGKAVDVEVILQLYTSNKLVSLGTFSITTAGVLLFQPDCVFNEYTRIQIKPQGRMFFTSLRCYDGAFSAAELGVSPLNQAAKAPRKVKTSVLTTKEAKYTFTGLVPTSRYEVKVRATDSERTSYWSDIQSVEFAGSTPVESVKVGEEDVLDMPVYDLSGRQVTRPSKGIYITKGKKYIK